MQLLLVFALLTGIATVFGETCRTLTECQQTVCNVEHGWWLHCTDGYCLCSHDTFTGKPCLDGSTLSCDIAHGTRCQDNGLHWRCVDQVCHCGHI